MFDSVDGKQCIDVFRLSELDERSSYETLLNNPTVNIIRDNFTYDKKGNPVITVWYIKELEDGVDTLVDLMPIPSIKSNNEADDGENDMFE